jgi:hypothetical protein
MTHLYLLSNVSGKRLNENFPASKKCIIRRLVIGVGALNQDFLLMRAR